MIRIIKNKGQIRSIPASKHKYMLYVWDKDLGDLYARLGFKPVVDYILSRIVYH